MKQLPLTSFWKKHSLHVTTSSVPGKGKTVPHLGQKSRSVTNNSCFDTGVVLAMFCNIKDLKVHIYYDLQSNTVKQSQQLSSYIHEKSM
jgi:hypothetical protein